MRISDWSSDVCSSDLPPVKVFIVNNMWLGMVRQWQELLHGERYAESYSDGLPDFIKLADAYGLTGLRATKPGEVDDVIRSEERRVGKVWGSTCGSRGSPLH